MSVQLIKDLKKHIANHLEYIEVAAGAALLSSAAVFAKVTTTPPVTDAFYRMLFGGIILFIIALIRRNIFWSGYQSIIWSLIAGFLFTLNLIFWHSSIDHIGPGVATILLNMQVFILAFIGIIFLREHTSFYFFIALPLILVAMYLLIYYKWSHVTAEYRLGVIQGLLSAIWYSFYILSLRKTHHVKNPLSVIVNLTYICAISAGIILIFTWKNLKQLTIPSWHDGVLLVSYAITSQVIGWLLVANGLKKAKITVAAFLLLLQPALAFVWDLVFLHRPTPLIEVLGSILALVAIYLALL